MINSFLRILVKSGLLLAVIGLTQDIPLKAPHLLPLPSVSFGISYLRLIPTNNMQINSAVSGWSKTDTLQGAIGTLDFELLRYRWWHHLFPESKYDASSSLRYAISNQLGSFDIPVSFPSSFLINNVTMSDYQMNILLHKFYLENRFILNFGQRSSVHGILGLGMSNLSLYNNPEGYRILDASGFDIDLGLGWKTTLLGRPGNRMRLGVDLGFSIRSFEFGEQDENIKLANGTSGSVSPIQSVSLNNPNLKVSLELGEFLFSAYTPYRDPYRMGLLNLSLGAGFVNYTSGVTINFDSTEISLEVPALGKVSQNYDLQLVRYNWPFHFIRQANIDVFSGAGVRIWKTSQITMLPTGWARALTDGTTEFSSLTFAPRVMDVYLDHEILYPLGSKLHTKFSAGTGYASMTLYENTELDRLIDANSLSWHMGVGLGYSVKGDGSSRILFGINLDYYHQAFDIDMSSTNLTAVTPGEIMPITYLNLSQPVISVDIGLIFGGQANAAQRAHKAFQKKQFTQALEMQEELLQLNPRHHNKEMILIQKQMVEDSLVTRYYKDVRTILNKGRLETAHALIHQGERPPGKAVQNSVESMKIEIADRALENVAEALKQLDYEQAEDLILLALKSDPSTYAIAKILLARSYIIRATVLFNSGVYERSLYWLKQADSLTERYRAVTVGLRKKIGEGRLDDANEGILKQDRQMVYESMQDAKALNPVLSEIVDEHLNDLEEAIRHVDEQKVAPLKRMAMDNLLDDVAGLDPENFAPRVGMKGSLIERYIGPPERQFKEGDYQLYVYPESEETEIWLYLREGIIEKIEHQNK